MSIFDIRLALPKGALPLSVGGVSLLNIISVKLEQLLKAKLSTWVTPAGKVMDVIEVQF
jgi:hypothetical protein